MLHHDSESNMSGKTHKGLARRLKRTRSGKVLRRASGKRHLLSHKSPERRRRLRKWQELSEGDRKSLERQFGKI